MWIIKKKKLKLSKLHQTPELKDERGWAELSLLQFTFLSLRPVESTLSSLVSLASRKDMGSGRDIFGESAGSTAAD